MIKALEEGADPIEGAEGHELVYRPEALLAYSSPYTCRGARIAGKRSRRRRRASKQRWHASTNPSSSGRPDSRASWKGPPATRAATTGWVSGSYDASSSGSGVDQMFPMLKPWQRWT